MTVTFQGTIEQLDDMKDELQSMGAITMSTPVYCPKPVMPNFPLHAPHGLEDSTDDPAKGPGNCRPVKEQVKEPR